MDNAQKLTLQIRVRLFIFLILTWVIPASTAALLIHYDITSFLVAIIIGGTIATHLSLVFAYYGSNMFAQPVKFILQALLHISPDHHNTQAPNVDKLRIGRQIVSSLILQIYQFASHENGIDLMEHRKQIIQASNVVSHVPLPIYVVNSSLQVIHASDTALEYSNKESAQLFGRPIFEALNLQFPNEFTLESWITACQNNRITDTAYWERVRVVSTDDQTVRQCDMSAHYDRDNQSGADFIITIFDRTEQYNEDDQSMSFIALAVHELRTPLTMLRGYIEVFKEELDGKLDNELKGYMLKMEASANQLNAFVRNILNVSKVEADQLELHLTEENWLDVIKKGTADMASRAKILGVTIDYRIEDKLPTVAVDPVSIYEVLNNLLDNALKYSGDSRKVIVSSKLNQNGMVETTVQDFGTGIPASVLPNLFEKFYRSHRTKSNIAGTGLGLYLIKCIIGAHGGQVWASSNEGQGSTFGFTVLPYSKLASDQKAGHNSEITRHAHGWIKNHSIYRR